MREFRVKAVTRYLVTDWNDYAGTGADVREVCETPNLNMANYVARSLGHSCGPDTLVNEMAPQPEFAATLYFTSEGLAATDALLRECGFSGGVLEVHQRGHSSASCGDQKATMTQEQWLAAQQGPAADDGGEPKWDPRPLVREIMVQEGMKWDPRMLRLLPYNYAAALRREAREAGDGEFLATLDQQQVAVDA